MMDTTSQASYALARRFKRRTRLNLFDRYYLNINQTGMGRERDFRLELAILEPKAEQVRHLSLYWLLASLFSLLTSGLLARSALADSGSDTSLPLLGAVLLCALLTMAFVTLFGLTIENKWVFHTRHSRFPLVEIPYTRESKQAAQQFVQQLEQASQLNLNKKDYSNEVLFAGEMRLLRRLANKQIISDKAYNKAKSLMMQKGA